MPTAFTGHRPNKLNGYDPKDNKALLWRLHEAIMVQIEIHKEDVFITGMALGIDQWAAKIVLKIKETQYPQLKLVCAIPCKNHSSKWNEEGQRQWQEIINKADQVIYVSEEEYSPKLMQLRNQWMVDNSDRVIAVWDGTPGGTANCVKYAKKKLRSEHYLTILNPNEKRQITS